jgi:hypothetical protein
MELLSLVESNESSFGGMNSNSSVPIRGPADLQGGIQSPFYNPINLELSRLTELPYTSGTDRKRTSGDTPLAASSNCAPTMAMPFEIVHTRPERR